MRLLFLLFGCVLLIGCGEDDELPYQRVPLTLDELAISVEQARRGFLLSDKMGGFVTGSVERGTSTVDLNWTISGAEIIRGLVLRKSPEGPPLVVESARILPHLVKCEFRGGHTISFAPLEPLEEGGLNAVLISVGGGGGAAVSLVPGGTIAKQKASGGNGALRWKTGRRGQEIVFYGGPSARHSVNTLAVDSGKVIEFLVCAGATGLADEHVRELYESAAGLLAQRTKRLTQLLNRTYARTSDSLLTMGINWMKISLDALVVEAQDTFIVAGVPWDGSIDGRANAQSITGLDLLKGDYATGRSVIRSLVRWQDSLPSRTTYGRIAESVERGRPRFTAADVTPWWTRELYDHITRANDTLLVRSLYPYVKRSLEGTYQYHVDGQNLLRHGDGETWMSSAGSGRGAQPAPRGDRAVELQLLWYFQQLIGSYLATYVGEWETAQEWAARAEQTSESFASVFVDTATNLVYDHIRPDGTPVAEMRPNSLFSLELMPSDTVQRSAIREVVSHLVYPYGVGTLAVSDKRFTSGTDRKGNPVKGTAVYNGPVWTWLAGQLAYALMQYDRQDFSYLVTESMVRHVLEEGTAGSLPEMFEARVKPGESRPRSGGSGSSARAMAEFVRSLYQDYLGIGVDGVARQITFLPKLPDHLSSADVTVYIERNPVHVRYEVGPDLSRMVLQQEQGEREIRINFIWTMANGDAWRGSTVLPSDGELRIIFAEEDVLAYHGNERVDLTGRWKLKQFSRRSEFSGIQFAGADTQ